MAHYEITTTTFGSSTALGQVERAIGRLEISGEGVVRRLGVSAPNGRIQIDMDLSGWGARAVGEAERIFAVLWYDAFGERTARHLGRLVGPDDAGTAPEASPAPASRQRSPAPALNGM